MVRWEPRRRSAQALRHADDDHGDLVSVVPLGLDPVDGGPVWAAPRGTVLVPGHLAWEPLATGRANYRITLDFPPERFHQLLLQEKGRLVGVHGNVVEAILHGKAAGPQR